MAVQTAGLQSMAAPLRSFLSDSRKSYGLVQRLHQSLRSKLMKGGYIGHYIGEYFWGLLRGTLGV